MTNPVRNSVTAPVTMPDLSVQLGSLSLKNPVMPASGTFGFGEEYGPFVPLASLGAVVTKAVTLEPTPGNPPPRLAETPAGLLNAIGLQNPGLEVFLREKLPWLRDQGATVIINLAGGTAEEFARLVEALDGQPGVAALELNVSCPNVHRGGLAFGTDPKVLSRLVGFLRPRTDLPLIVKLSPNVSDVALVARAAAHAGADILSLINTLPGMAIDVARRRPVLGNVSGGLSGPAVKPVALLQVWKVAGAVDVPLIGMGGIGNAADAIEFLLAGAGAVAVGTATFVNPRVCLEIREGIARYLSDNGFSRVSEIVGLARRGY